MKNGIRATRSVCPVCLKNLPAVLSQGGSGVIYLEKECPEHGAFSVPVWNGTMDFHNWIRHADPLPRGEGENCPAGCGICPEHEIGSCCVLLEVTKRCDLRCRFCFANGGSPEEDPTTDALKASIRDIVRQRGKVLLQLSGGEPTLREDLPELIRFAKEAGCSHVQLNTNGIRLAQDPEYAGGLRKAGLDIVFLQFDGTREDIYEALRGKPLLEVKRSAIEVCSRLGLGVTLVPTVVPGVNTDDLGNIIAFAKGLVPAVRGVHFQPVSYFGRYPGNPEAEQRYPLDQLMTDISRQAGIPVESFLPSRCDHPLCGFHGNYLVEPSGRLRPLSSFAHSSPKRGCAGDNRAYVARHWIRYPAEPAPRSDSGEEMDFDAFLYRIRHESLALSAMAFQDAGNLNIERLHRCSLHVYEGGGVKPFCGHYLSAMEP